MIHKWIGLLEAVIVILLLTTGGIIKQLAPTSEIIQFPYKMGDASNAQVRPTPTPKPNQRCIPKRLPACSRPNGVNAPPDVELKASVKELIITCRKGKSSKNCIPSTSQQVTLQTTATDADGDSLRYEYSSSGGNIKGEGAKAVWNLTTVQPGMYVATVMVDDKCGCVAFASTVVKVSECSDCK